MVALDLNDINLYSPYKINLCDDNAYSFITDFGVRYRIYFMRDENLTFDETYQFVIVNANNIKSPSDPKLRECIFLILKNFFDLNNHTILYICDTGDGRQAQRNRLFANWFVKYGFQEGFSILQSMVKDSDGIDNYVALLSRNDNPHLAYVSREFLDLVRILGEKP